MELKLARHLWGVPQPFSESTFSCFQQKGYTGIDLYLKGYLDSGAIDVPSLAALCQKQDFFVVLQIITHGKNVAEHLASLRAQLEVGKALNPILVNIHSGRDAFTEAESVTYFKEALQIETDSGIRFVHETHRGRIFYNPWVTAKMLEVFPELKLCCDFSHWVCVCERLIDDQLDIIQLCAERCHHLHARVGYMCGPQVPDPRAPEFANELTAHERWWDIVWKAQKKRGETVSTLTPEFGPYPYQQLLPYTQEPTADLEAICDWQATRQRERFYKQYK